MELIRRIFINKEELYVDDPNFTVEDAAE